MQQPFRLLKSKNTEIHIISGVFTSVFNIKFYDSALCGIKTSELDMIPNFAYLSSKNVKTAIDSIDGLACEICKDIFEENLK